MALNRSLVGMNYSSVDMKPAFTLREALAVPFFERVSREIEGPVSATPARDALVVLQCKGIPSTDWTWRNWLPPLILLERNPLLPAHIREAAFKNPSQTVREVMDVDIYKVLPACLGSISYPIHVRRNELVMVSPVYSLIVDFIIFDECRTKVLAVIQCLGGDDAFVLTDHGNLVPDIPSHQHLVRRAHLLAFVLNVPEIIFFTPSCDAIICLSWCDKRVLNGKDTDFLECTPTLYTSKRTYDDNPKTDNVRMLIFSAVMRSIAYHKVPAHSCWVHKRKNGGEQEASESALQKYARLS